jgi:hypothetical protein
MISDREAGERHRLRQAQKLLDLFEDAHGKTATSQEELESWLASPDGRAALAYDLDAEGKIIP